MIRRTTQPQKASPRVKSKIDALLKQQNLDGLVVLGTSAHNPAMYYMANGASVGERSILVKPRGRKGALFVSGMEREEAAKSGLRVFDLYKAQLAVASAKKQRAGNAAAAQARLLGNVLQQLGLSGKVALAGLQDAGFAAELVAQFNRAKLGASIAFAPDLISQAAVTKDADEVARIRAVAVKTVAVVGDIHDFLSQQRTKGDVLVDRAGQPVTIGAVKSRINLKLAEQGIVDAEGGTIFAQGRDAGIPHSRGRADQALRLGQTIVFDIFPAEPGGGYFYDFTRTWCLGYAPDEAQALYDQVREIYQQVMATLKVNAPTADYQRMTTEYFESHGHPTIASKPGTTDGYVHSLGHGIGLQVHEAPSLSARSSERLTPGMVFSVEPGLYYPERGMGVRLEDSVWLNPATRQCEVLAPYPDDLVVPVKKS